MGRDAFDRAVEALIAYRYPDADVRVFDGRGGDGGRDVVVRQGDRVRIYQLKYFPGGFSSEQRQRRRQIKKSFEAALAHEPYEWTLVVPCNLTEGEQEFVDDLDGTSAVERVGWWGRANLDALLAGYPDLQRALDRDTAKEYLEAVGRRQALVEGHGDLAANLIDLRRAVNAADPHWTFDFATTADGFTRTLRAKHPNAHNLSPVTMRFSVEETLDPELREQLDRMLDFGLSGELEIPVTSFTVDGPPLVSEVSEGGFVLLKSVRGAPNRIPVEFRFLDADGYQIGSHIGFPTHVGEGRAGRSLTVEFYGGLAIAMDLPSESEHGRFNLDLHVTDAEPRVALNVDRMLRTGGASSRVEVLVDGHGLLSFSTNGFSWMPPSPADDWDYLVSLSDDMEFISRETGTMFVVPAAVPAKERVFLRCARLLLEGQCVVVPDHGLLTATLSPEGDELDWPTLLRGDGGLKVEFEHYGFEVLGRSIDLGVGAIFTLSYEVVSLDGEVLTDKGQLAHDQPVRFRPRRAKSWWVYLPAKVTADQVLLPAPWEIAGIDEPQDVVALDESAQASSV